MDYSQLSDFEINKRVFNILMKGRCWNRQGNGVFNYCNNVADAWSIIAENNISIIFDNPSMTMATSNCVGWYSDEDPPIHASSSNPLRAAMIVFLMMQQGK